MTPSSISRIRRRIAGARGVLLEPDGDLSRVLMELESAAEEIPHLGPETPVVEIEALRLELARLAQLASNGTDFWRSWARLLGLEPGYTQGGVLAPEPTVSRIAVRG